MKVATYDVQVASTSGAVLSSRHGFASDYQQRLQHADAHLPIHEAQDECEGLELLGAFHTQAGLKNASGDRGFGGQRSWLRSAALVDRLPLHFYLRPLTTVSLFLRRGLPVHREGRRQGVPLWGTTWRELRAAAGVLPVAFAQLIFELQQEVLCSDACPSGWAAHPCSWPQDDFEQHLAWNERWRSCWTSGEPARLRALNTLMGKCCATVQRARGP